MTDTEATEIAAAAGDVEAIHRAVGMWWVPLATGVIWLLFAITVFRFDWTSVSSISILFGVIMLAAGVDELLAVPGAHGGWKIAYVLLALAFVVIGVIAFIHPGNTFTALAGVMSFYFIIKGIFDLCVALAAHGVEGWWIRLAVGIAELVIGFWAAGDFGHREILLVVWVGAAALLRGITQIVFAFALRSAKHATSV